jgi:hypothetical protein
MTSTTAGPRRTPSPPPVQGQGQPDSPEIGPAPQVGQRRSRVQADLPPGDPPAQRACVGSPDAPVPRSLSPLPSHSTATQAELNPLHTAFGSQQPAAPIPDTAGPPNSSVQMSGHYGELPPHPFDATFQEFLGQAPMPNLGADMTCAIASPRRTPSPLPALEQPGLPEIVLVPRAAVASPHALAQHSVSPSPSHSVTVQASLLNPLDAALGLPPAAPAPPDAQAALSREQMRLPARPTTPSLLAKMKQDSEKGRHNKAALNRGVVSVRHTLRNRVEQQRLQRLGIKLHSDDVGQDGRVQRRPATLTPFFERAEREALECLEGLTDADMSLENQAILMTGVIRAHLGKLTVFDEHGQVAEWIAPDPNLPGCPTAPVARTLGQRSAEKSPRWSKDENGRLTLLAAAYSIAVLGLNDAQANQVLNRASGQRLGTLRFTLKLQAVGERQGPFAIALVHKLFEPVWTAQQSTNAAADGEARRVNAVPTNHRAALVDALLRLPEGTMDDLIRAADSPDDLRKVCEGIEDRKRANADYKAFSRDTRKLLHHALQRLQGLPYPHSPLVYEGAGPMNEALQWLKAVKQRTSQPGVPAMRSTPP